MGAREYLISEAHHNEFMIIMNTKQHILNIQAVDNSLCTHNTTEKEVHSLDQSIAPAEEYGSKISCDRDLGTAVNLDERLP